MANLTWSLRYLTPIWTRILSLLQKWRTITSRWCLDDPVWPITTQTLTETRTPIRNWSAYHLSATSSNNKDFPDLLAVPPDYNDLKQVFSKSGLLSLPPHRPYDGAINLLPGTTPPEQGYTHCSQRRVRSWTNTVNLSFPLCQQPLISCKRPVSLKSLTGTLKSGFGNFFGTFWLSTLCFQPQVSSFLIVCVCVCGYFCIHKDQTRVLLLADSGSYSLLATMLN